MSGGPLSLTSHHNKEVSPIAHIPSHRPDHKPQLPETSRLNLCGTRLDDERMMRDSTLDLSSPKTSDLSSSHFRSPLSDKSPIPGINTSYGSGRSSCQYGSFPGSPYTLSGYGLHSQHYASPPLGAGYIPGLPSVSATSSTSAGSSSGAAGIDSSALQMPSCQLSDHRNASHTAQMSAAHHSFMGHSHSLSPCTLMQSPADTQHSTSHSSDVTTLKLKEPYSGSIL